MGSERGRDREERIAEIMFLSKSEGIKSNANLEDLALYLSTITSMITRERVELFGTGINRWCWECLLIVLISPVICNLNQYIDYVYRYLYLYIYISHSLSLWVADTSKGNHSWNICCRRWILPNFEFCMTGIKHCVVFFLTSFTPHSCPWNVFILLCGISSFCYYCFTLWLLHRIPLCKFYILFFHSIVERNLGYFQVRAILSKASVSILVHVFGPLKHFLMFTYTVKLMYSLEFFF